MSASSSLEPSNPRRYGGDTRATTVTSIRNSALIYLRKLNGRTHLCLSAPIIVARFLAVIVTTVVARVYTLGKNAGATKSSSLTD